MFTLLQDVLSWTFNSAYDHIRVIQSTRNVCSPPLILVPQSDDWAVCERLLTMELNIDGFPDRVHFIRAYGWNGLLCGLSFVYESGTVRAIGRVTSGDEQGWLISKDEEMILLEASGRLAGVEQLMVGLPLSSPHKMIISSQLLAS